jgi:hypothetical protein
MLVLGSTLSLGVYRAVVGSGGRLDWALDSS